MLLSKRIDEKENKYSLRSDSIGACINPRRPHVKLSLYYIEPE